MKILIIHNYYTERGGEDVVFEQECQLLESTNEVQKITFHNKRGLVGLFQFFFSIWNITAALKLKKCIINFNPDVIHIHNLHFASGPLIIRTAKRHDKKVILTLHNYRIICPTATLFFKNKIYLNSKNQSFPWEIIFKKGFRNSFLLTFWLAFVNWFHKKINTWNMVDNYIVLTNFARDTILESKFGIDTKKIIVKQNFTTPNQNLDSIRNNTFLFVGRLSSEKGIIFLIDVCLRNNIQLHIIGSGELENEVLQKISHTDTIKFLGKKNTNEIKLLMKEYMALLFPSLWFEGMPMVILEAFASGLPIIGCDLGAIPSIINHEYNGLIFEANNEKNFIETINIWNNYSQIQKEEMSRNAYNTYLEYYTPEINLITLKKIYN